MQDASSKQQTNKQNTNPIISRQDYHLTQPCPSEENKQNNKRTQHKSHPIGNLNHQTNLRRAETKRKKEFNLEARKKETSKTLNLKNNSEKAEKYCTNEGTN